MLIVSNVFMTFAWYGHLKHKGSALFLAIVASWGIAFFEGKGVRHFVDHQAAVASPIAELIKRYPIKSTNVIAHIRKATQGQVALENCHPFVREMWGRYWVFAHNGDLKDFAPVL
ncbi:MAG TPA: hypothetical protein DHE23_08635, partial [Agrobacterium sp.]|nr:hypothetical protein [Agrobacterium sp.]